VNPLPFGKTRIHNSVFSLCVFAFLAVFGQGATYYVSTTGSDSNPGTQSAPFRHVSHGASVAHAGDTVIVMNGTYDNEGQVADSSGGGSVVTVSNAGSSGNPITIMAQNRGAAVLNAASTSESSLGCYGAWSYFDLSHTAYVVIQGFVIENACVNAFHINATAHDITLRWNEIRNIGNWNNPASTLSPSGTYLNSSEYNITFDGNIFHDIGGGSNVNQQHAIYSASSNLTIVNNIFYNQTHGWDIQTAGGRNIYIANNTFAFPNPSRSGHIILWDDGVTNGLSNVVIANNIFYQPLSYAIVAELDGGGSISGCSMQNNLTTVGTLFDNGSTFSGGGVSCSQSSNLTSTDPKFMSISGTYDFHVQAGSPAIDSAMADPYTEIDLDDIARPVNSIYDRGAYEYHTASSGSSGSGTSSGSSGSGSSGSGSSGSGSAGPASIFLAANPSTASITAGGSLAIKGAATVTGSAAPAFSVSGLPSGVSGSFSPASCSGSCTTTLTLTASNNASAAQATLTVTATSTGATSGSAWIALTVNAAVISNSPSPTGDYTTGLVGEWKLLGNLTDPVHGDNGAAHGNAVFSASPSLFNGNNTPALLLDGKSGYVSIGDESAIELTKQLTVAFWARSVPSVVSSDTDPRLVAKVYDWDIKLNGGLYPQFSAAGAYAMANYAVPLYTWTHIVFTFSGGTVKAYINGQQVSFSGNTFSSRITLPSNAYGIYLGADSGLTYFYPGSLSDVRIYSRALAAGDVSALYAAGSSAILH